MPLLARLFLLATLALLALTAQAEERVTYFVPNAQGSPVAAMDAQGNVIWRESYAPYGQRLTKPAANNAKTAYTGKPEDRDTGLVYMGARWYDPETARFGGVDPQGFKEGNPQTFGRYVYANNSPDTFNDPDGECAQIVVGAAMFIAKEVAGQVWEAETGLPAAFSLKGLVKEIREVPKHFDDVTKAATKLYKSVTTPYGQAHQATDAASLAARKSIEEGAPLYKVGTLGKSDAAESQFFALQHPSSPGYVSGYGIPAKNVANTDFMVTGTLRPGANFVTRPAPGIGANGGGSIEAVVERGGVQVNSFTMTPPKMER